MKLAFLAGAATLGLILIVSSAATQSFPANRFVFGPHPRDYVTIREGTPFVVPAGKVFVPVAFANTDSSADQPFRCEIDGVTENSGYPPPGEGIFINAAGIPRGLVAQPGQSVAAAGGANASADVRIWGYLAPATTGYSAYAVSPGLDYVPRPSAYVRIESGLPLAVPTGKVFVLTALGTKSAPAAIGATRVTLSVDGVGELQFSRAGQGGAGNHVQPTPAGFTAQAGSTVSVSASPSTPTAVAWGYFADL